MGLYFVLICSICVLLNVNGVKSVEEVDESILEKIIRADQGEGNGVQIQEEITTTEIRKDIQNELVRNMDKLKPPSPLFSMGGPQTQIHRRVYFPPETEHGKPEQKPEPNCKDDPVTGFCRASIPRYYFDTKSRTCEQFTYGGCGGNGNNYLTKEDCENTCLNGSSGWQS